MIVESDVTISKDKTKIIIKLNNKEFIKGKWLKYVKDSYHTDVHYTARIGVLVILDTPRLDVIKREV